MDNFNLKQYLNEGRIHQDISESQVSEKKYKQGYDDREDESLGARKGAEKDKKQSMKDRRDDSYGKFGKRDAEAKGKAKGPGKNKVNKESVEPVDESASVLAGVGALLGSTYGLAKLLDYMKKNYPEKVDQFVKAVERGKKSSYSRVNEEPVSAAAVAAGVASIFGGGALIQKLRQKAAAGDFGEKGKEFADALSKAGRAAGNVSQSRNYQMEEEIEEYGKKPMYDEDDKDAKNEEMKKPMYDEDDKDTKNEEMKKPMYDEDDKDSMKEETGRMTVEALKAKIREDILSVLSEAEEDVDVDVDVDDEVEADVDVDVQDTVSVDAEGDDIEIEKKAVKAKVQVGLSPEEEIVQDSLKAAMDAANALGNEKLADQIGNTITFFTREYVVGGNTD